MLRKKLCVALILCLLPSVVYAEERQDRSEKRRVEYALANLDSTDYAMAESAIYKLEQMADHAIPFLIRELRDEDISKRKLTNIIYTLGRIGPKAKVTVPLLMSFLRHENPDIRAVSIIALGKIGQGAGDAVPQLVKLQYDPNDWISESAQEALRSINTKEARKGLKEFKVANQAD